MITKQILSIQGDKALTAPYGTSGLDAAAQGSTEYLGLYVDERGHVLALTPEQAEQQSVRDEHTTPGPE